MESESSKIVPFPKDPASRWIDAYQRACLMQWPDGTAAVYEGILRHFTQWIAQRAGKREMFHPEVLTTRLIERYLADLDTQGYSFSHRKRAKSVITHFCQWLVDDPETSLHQNPARGITIARPAGLAQGALHAFSLLLNACSSAHWSRKMTYVGKLYLPWLIGLGVASQTSPICS